MVRLSTPNRFTNGTLTNAAFSVVCRFQPSTADGQKTLFACASGGQPNEMNLFLPQDGAIFFNVDHATTSAQWTTANRTFASGSWYNFAATFNGIYSDASGLTVYASGLAGSGIAGLSASTVALATYQAPVGSPFTFADPLYFGNDVIGAESLQMNLRDVGVFEGVLSSSDIELFGKGLAPFQLTSATLRASPAETLKTFPSTMVGIDRVNGSLLTVSGTFNGAGHSNFDGPIWDAETGTPSTFATGTRSRYHASYVIKDANNRVCEIPDLSGRGAHFCQQTGVRQPVYETINGRPAVVFDAYGSNQQGVLSGIINVGTTAIATTRFDHGLDTGYSVTVAGSTPTNYNGTFTITASGLRQFTYTMGSDPGAAASGILTYTLPAASKVLFVRATGGEVFSSASNAHTFAWIGGAAACAGHTSTSTNMNLIRTSDTGLTSQCVLAVPCSGNGKEGIIMNIAGQTPTSQTGVLIPGSNVTSVVAAWKGSNVSPAITAICDTATGVLSYSSTATANRYVYEMGGHTDTHNAVVWFMHEMRVWNDDKAAVLSTVENYLRSQWGLSSPQVVLCVFGSSTQEGQGAARSLSYVTQLNTNGAVKVVNLGEAGISAGSVLLSSTSSPTGTFTRNEIVTNAASASGTFVAYDSGSNQVWLTDHTGTWGTSGVMTGQSSGATIAYAASQITSGARSVFMASRLATAAAIWALYTSAGKAALISSASNGMGNATLASKSGMEMAALRSFVLTAKAGTPGLRVLVQPHQPRSGGSLSEHDAYRNLLRTQEGTDFDKLLDFSTLPQFDTYTDASDYSNYDYYHADFTHLNINGHALIAAYEAPIITSYFGLDVSTLGAFRLSSLNFLSNVLKVLKSGM